ncbi:MAG: S41 family peptidase [Bacteroidota bacterium]
MLKSYVISVFLLINIYFLNAQNPLINDPSLNNDGTKIAFNYQGDIWIANANGTNIKRLTVHEAYDAHPLWSVDGKSISFHSNRYGNNDIFTIPVEGGTPKRLTYLSSDDLITDYTENGEILFNTRRNFNQIEWEPEIQTVNVKGGTPYLKMKAFGYDATLSPDKKNITFVKGPCRIQREAYKGPANKDIWLYNIDRDNYLQLTNFDGNDFYPKWADDQTIYYQSAKSGKYNVYRMKISDKGVKIGKEEQITDFKDMGIFSFNISKNGKKIILVKGDQLFIVDTNTKVKSQVSLNLHSDYKFDPIVHKTYSGNIEDMAPSPDSKYSAFEIRGDIFITENNKDKSKSVNLTSTSSRDKMVTWLSNDALVFVSDRDGQNDLYLLKSADPNEKNLFKTLKREVERITNTIEDESSPIVAPNGKQVAFNRGRGQLIVANISSTGALSGEKILLDGWDTASGVSWSPDSKWLAYNFSDLDFNEEVYIQRADNTQQPINVSMHPKRDQNPVWSPDGSKLAFSSIRNNSDYDVWFVWLKLDDWQKTKEDWDEEDDSKSDDKEKDKKDDKEKDKEKSVSPVIIDTDQIHKRQVQVTSYTGGEFVEGFSKDGKTIYYATGGGGRGDSKTESDLYEIKWDGKDKKALTTGDSKPRNITIDQNIKYIYYTAKGGKLNRLKLKDGKKESLPIKTSMDIDYTKEANQIFNEAWKAINDGFYDPDFHGQNWESLRDKYKPLAIKASTRTDFQNIFNWMLGQINASHMGLRGGESRSDLQKDKTGLLGLTLIPENSGKMKVEYITKNMPAGRKVSELKPGDIITAVNGTTLTKTTNFYSLLNNLSNEKIYLNITNPKGIKREVVIRPKSTNRSEKYEAWVDEKKRLTDVYSNGKLGYIHIQGMNWTSFEVFERELTAAGLGKDGIVIDVRFNGGGWTTDYLMAVLNVDQHAYTIPRGASKDLKKDHLKFKEHYPYSERLPLSSWTKPSVALCNESSYSNAEIFSHAYKNLGIGPLVGIQTFGAVISTGSQRLIDGSRVRMPFRGWYIKASETNMEFNGAIPDFIVKNNPDSKSKGDDKQLKKAVEQLLLKLK